MLEHVGILPMTAERHTGEEVKEVRVRGKRGRKNANERDREGDCARAKEEREKGGGERRDRARAP